MDRYLKIGSTLTFNLGIKISSDYHHLLELKFIPDDNFFLKTKKETIFIQVREDNHGNNVRSNVI